MNHDQFSSIFRYVSNALFHVTDWLPTILSAVDASEDTKSIFADIDGINQYGYFFRVCATHSLNAWQWFS